MRPLQPAVEGPETPDASRAATPNKTTDANSQSIFNSVHITFYCTQMGGKESVNDR